MKTTKLLIIGYSNFVKNRLVKSIKKNKKIDYRICSKTKVSKDIYYKDYLDGLNFNPDIIYISLTNHLHYKFAKIFLKRGYNVIVDKPITDSLKRTLQLIRIAKKKNLLLSEATVFNYHIVFSKILDILGGRKKLEFLQSNFNIPQIKKLKDIQFTKSDCFMDMSPYAASLLRMFLDKKNLKIDIRFTKFPKGKTIKSFYLLAEDKNLKYFGNFSFNREYLSQIIFFSKTKIVYLNHQAFALPSSKNIRILIKEKNKYKHIFVKKDDCIYNYFNKILRSVKKMKYDDYYNMIIEDAKIRESLKKINRFQ